MRLRQQGYVIPFKAVGKAGGVPEIIKDETRCNRAFGRGERAWDTPVEKYCFESAEIIMDLMDELRSIKMTTSQNLDGYLLRAEQLRVDLAVHKEPVRGRQSKNTITNGILEEYLDVLLTVCRERGCLTLTSHSARCHHFTGGLNV